MFCAPEHVFSGTVCAKHVGSYFVFCASELVFGGTAGVRSRFHVFHSRTRFRRYRGRRVPFSCFTCPNTFSAILRARVPFSCFSRPDSFPAVSRARVPFSYLLSRICFRRYRGRRVSFSCFARPDSFSAEPRASGTVFLFCAPGHVFGGTKGVGSRFSVLLARTRFQRYQGVRSHFHVLRSRTRFRRYRGRLVLFSYFTLSDSLSSVSRASGLVFSCFAHTNSFRAEPRASGGVFIICAPGHIFGGTEGVGSHFSVLRARTHFRRYRGRRVPFSYFALPYSFSALPSPLGPVFIFCSPGLVFNGTQGV
jgi:hypothetical protein